MNINKKWLWIGTRLSDGLLYSRALNGLDVFFSLDSLEYTKTSFSFHSLTSNNFNKKWTSNDISQLISLYDNEINQYLQKGYGIFPYYLSAESLIKINDPNIFNKLVFNNQLTRSLQRDLCNQSGVRTPNWTIPHNKTWSELVSLLGEVIVFQFDNTSFGMGTFIIHNEKEYKLLNEKYGRAAIATEYLNDGYSCSTHLWITKDNVLISPASVQIIEQYNLQLNCGIKGFSFKGNDFGLYEQNVKNNNDIDYHLHKIGLMLQKIGIYGLLGIDYIVQGSKFYYLETNFRLQSSTPLLSYLQPLGKGNVINCLIPKFTSFSNVESAYQYYANVNTSKILSGCYAEDGKYLSEFNPYKSNNKNSIIVFSSKNIGMGQSLRIIGFGIGCDEYGNIKSKVKTFLKNLIREFT